MTELRDARPDDAPAIAAIWNPIIRDTVMTFWPDARSEAEIIAYITQRQQAGHAMLVAEDAGRITGFGSYTQFRAGAGYAHSMEHTLYVADWARARGTGRRLLHALENHATARGVRLMVGGITGSNQNSIAFHARLGYVERGRILNAGWKYDRFHDLVLMVKDLRP